MGSVSVFRPVMTMMMMMAAMKENGEREKDDAKKMRNNLCSPFGCRKDFKPVKVAVAVAPIGFSAEPARSYDWLKLS